MSPQPVRTAASSPPETTLAPHPDLVKRQTQANFVGYTYDGLEWLTKTCVSGAFFTETRPYGSTIPGIAACVLTTGIPNNVALSCTASTMFYKTTSYTCNAGNHCVTGIVATSKGVEVSGDLFYECNTIADWIVYKTTPAQAAVATTTSQTTTSTPSTTLTSSSSTSSIVTTTSSSSSPTPTISPVPSSNKGFTGAAIAGAVVGPVCGVALILGLAFMLLRRRRNKSTPPPVDPSQAQQYPPPGQQYPPTQQYQQYPTTAGGYAVAGYGEGKEAVQANVNPVDPNRPMSIPPAYAPGSPTENAAMGAMPPQQQPQPWTNNPQNMQQPQMQMQNQQPPQMQMQNQPPPMQMQGQAPPPMHMQGGPPPAELPTNPQVSGMPSELPDWNRQGH